MVIFAYTVVKQVYKTSVGEEYVIKGNSALLKCNIPSFVADFVQVTGWTTDAGETFLPSNNYGKNSFKIRLKLVFSEMSLY